MSETPAKHGLFSSLSLGRSSRAPKPAAEPTLAHPLLGASSSTLNLADQSDSSLPLPQHNRQGSFTQRSASGSDALNGLPYKPRQKHGGGIGSTGSATSIFTPVPNSSPTIAAAAAAVPIITSPVTPGAVTTTSTSTSATFALPPSAMDGSNAMAESSSSVPTGGSATSQLQRQSLKAAAQGIGLGNGSMGMSMIDAILDKGMIGRSKGPEGGDWGELLKVISSGKAVLLLPTTPSSSLPMAPQTLRDHIAFISPPISVPVISDESGSSEKPSEINVSVVVTLSGLLGTLSGSNIVFESSLPPDSLVLAALREPSTRQSALASLKPTHLPSLFASPTFPAYSLSSESAILSFPPIGRGHTASTDPKEKDHAKPAAGKLGRINPFASFFGTSPQASSSPTMSSPVQLLEGPSTPDKAVSPVHSRPTSPTFLPTSPNASLSVIETDNVSILSNTAVTQSLEGYQVTAYTVSKPIRFAEVHKAVIKSVRVFIRDELSRLPDKIIDRVIKLVLSGVCPVSGTGENKELLKSHHATDGDTVITLDFSDPSATGERLQDVIEGIYDDLIVHFRADSSNLFGEPGALRRRASGSIPWSRGENEGDSEELRKERKDKKRRERDEQAEKDASEATERVEAVICRLLYNRLFSPMEADDSKHDEALASRIAALNMLDLSLDHLGLDTRPIGDSGEPDNTIADGLATLVDQIGLELQKLSTPSCLTPKEKADVLIRAHKLVVDGLDHLPPIELRPEGEPYQAPPPQVSTSESGLAPMTDLAEAPSLSTQSSASSIATDGTKASSASTGNLQEATPHAFRTTSPPVPDLNGNDIPDAAELHDAMSEPLHTNTTDSPPPELDAIPSPVPDKPRSTKQGTSGADLILPIIIYSVVKSNPPQLASQLMYLRRYRSAICLTGEASYAIVNITAVVEFLEHVDLAELGLGCHSDKVMSIDDLSPIGLDYLHEGNADAASIASASSRLRGRVFQVGEMAGNAAGSANKVITGVLDSWTTMRGLISSPVPPAEAEATVLRPSMGGRQASTFSLANVTATVANIAAAAAATTTAARTRSRTNSRASAAIPEHVWGANQELQEVSSRPESILEQEDDRSEQGTVHEHENSGEDPVPDDVHMVRERSKSDARSIRSVSSMMQESRKERERERKEKEDRERDKKEESQVKEDERQSLGTRLASIGGFGRLAPGEDGVKGGGFLASFTGNRSASQGHARRSSLLGETSTGTKMRESVSSPADSSASFPLPLSPLNQLPSSERIDPPIERFMTGELGDIKLSEIGELLRDYRRLGAAIIAHNARQP
ncbi:hypothetical protein BCR39DRAFT_526838 [Naematelia encephala]|uniref:VPS9 domain-containing protein n=1 Tax=Naematelia encephala TaxID=71784 RepID=A0A1Y2B8Q7_9TREE|nr:hypothetical protein BCR39DRAFT_526838 [Naematelia encephala]